MNDKLRKTLPLVGALALTSSALFASAGAALAGKEPPIATANSPHCTTYLGDADYDVNIDFSANKGKWVFVSVQVVTLAGREIPNGHSSIQRHDMGNWIFVEATDDGQVAEAAEAVVKVWNRKGEKLREQRFSVCP